MKRIIALVAGMALSASAAAGFIGDPSAASDAFNSQDNYTFQNEVTGSATTGSSVVGTNDSTATFAAPLNTAALISNGFGLVGASTIALDTISVVFDQPNIATVITNIGKLSSI